MKKSFLCLISAVFLLLTIVSCQGEYRGQGIEDAPYHPFDEHERRTGEGYGFANQQKYQNNPIARMVTRDDRPSRGMNGFVDRDPVEMRSQDHTHPYSEKKFENIPPFYRNVASTRQTNPLDFAIRQVVKEYDPYAGVVVVEVDHDILVGINEYSGNHKSDIKLDIQFLSPNRNVYLISSPADRDKLLKFKEHVEIGKSPQRYSAWLNEIKNES